MKTTGTYSISNHANFDSLPLRYGFSSALSGDFRTLDIFNMRNVVQEGDDKFHCDADFINPTTKEQETGHFVIGDKKKYYHTFHNIITVWRHDSKTENELSKHMTSLRNKNAVSVDDLISLNPAYKSGSLRTVADLIDHVSDLKTDKQIETVKEEAYAAGKASAEERNSQIAKVELKTMKQGAEWAESDFESQGVLKEVSVIKDKSGVMVLKLLLEDGTVRQTKWDQDTIIDRARVYRELEGEEIETTVSNTSTSSWSGKRFFNSVRVVNGMVATTEEIVQF